MIETARFRLLLVAILLVGQCMLFPLYAQQPVNSEVWVLPGTEDFIEDPNRFLGNRVVSEGFVQTTDPMVIEATADGARYAVTLERNDFSSSIGDKVRVYGELTGPRTIRVLNGFAVPPGGLWYTWIVSLLAGIWVLGRLIRHWRVDIRTPGFRPSEHIESIREILRRVRTKKRGDSDA